MWGFTMVYFIWEIFGGYVKRTIGSLLLSRPLMLQDLERYVGAFICFMFFLIFLLIMYLLWNIHKTFQRLRKQIQLYERNAEQNESVLESVESLRKWKHDYLNHLLVIQRLTEMKEYEQLGQYVNCQKKYLSEMFPYFFTGNGVIDAILMEKYSVAKSEHIPYEYTIVLPKQLPVSDIEMTGILGNLLDNAIESCRELKGNQDTSLYIKVILKPQRSMFRIYVENSSSGNYRYNSDGRLQTTKKEIKHRGYGLSNIIDIANAHSGFCNIVAGTNFFSVDVYIPL